MSDIPIIETQKRILNPQTDYANQYLYTRPYYKYTRVLPMTGSQNVTVSATSTSESMFEFPAKVFNPAKNKLFYNRQTVLHAAKALWNRVDVVSEISQVDLSTRSGVRLAELNFIQNHSKIFRKMNTKFADYMTNSEIDGLYPANKKPTFLSTLTGVGTVAGTSATFDNVTTNVNTITTSFETREIVGTAAGAVFMDESEYAFSSILEHKHRISAVGAASALKPVLYDFGEIFQNTTLGIDKDIYFCGEAVILRILWGPGNKIAWGSDAVDAITNPVSTTSNTNLTDICIYMAVESDLDIQNQVINTVMSKGMQLLVPYTNSYKINIPSGSVHNVSLRFNRSHGRLLQKIILSPFNVTDSAHLAYDNCNGGTLKKLNTYYTSLDSQRIQEFNVDTAVKQDWLLHRDMLKGSVIQNVDQYNNNWFHCEDFSYISHSVADKVSVDKHDLVLGLPLDVEKRYDFTAYKPDGAMNYFVWAITQRLLVLQPNNIHFE